MVDQIARNHHQIRLGLLHLFDHVAKVAHRHFIAGVKVGQLCDAEAFEALRQIADGHRHIMPVDPERLDLPPIHARSGGEGTDAKATPKQLPPRKASGLD